MMTSSRVESGQATVELAFSVLVLTVVFFLLLQVGLVARDQVLVTQAAREAARAAAVDPSPGAAAGAAVRATRLNPAKLATSVGPRPDGSGYVRVEVSYEGRVVMLGRTLLEPRLSSAASMKVEQAGL